MDIVQGCLKCNKYRYKCENVTYPLSRKLFYGLESRIRQLDVAQRFITRFALRQAILGAPCQHCHRMEASGTEKKS